MAEVVEVLLLPYSIVEGTLAFWPLIAVAILFCCVEGLGFFRLPLTFLDNTVALDLLEQIDPFVQYKGSRESRPS